MYLWLLWEKDEHLVGGIVIMGHEDNQIIPGRSALRRLVAKLSLQKKKKSNFRRVHAEAVFVRRSVHH